MIEQLTYDLRRILRRGAGVQIRVANTELPTPVKVTSIVDNGAGVATVTTETAHGWASLDDVVIFGAYEPRFNGTFTITVTGASTFTYAVTGSTAATATGVISAAKSEVLAVEERFISVGHIRDAKVSSEPMVTAKSTSGAQHLFGSDFTLTFTMMQTSDTELAELENLTQSLLDVIVLPRGCGDQHTDKGVLLSQLHNGFLLYAVNLTISGDIDLGGGDSGLVCSIMFYVSVGEHHTVVVGED